MKLKSNNSEQKLRGGYYTPLEIADFIIKWAVNNEDKVYKVLEPSCGDGSFLQSMLNNLNIDNVDCTAIELIDHEADKAKELVDGIPNIRVLNEDFFSIFNKKLKKEKFDLVIGNPPYIRYQYLTPEQRETQSTILTSNGMKSNKLINSWVSFIVASVQILNENGKIGMVIPAELLQVAYAEDLRMFLVDNLSKITVITFEELIFPNVQQEVVLLLGEKRINSNLDDNEISIIQLKNVDDLLANFGNIPIEYKHVDHSKDKWTKYFLTNEEITLIRDIEKSDKFVNFSDVGQVDIGITTGNNDYFSVNKETVQKFKLEEIVLPLIGRSSHASGLEFLYEDWLKNVNKGVNAHLINFPNTPYEDYPKEHREYIELGEKEEVNKGYKCSIRERWYRIPSIWAPDAFFLRRNNTFPKFVLNKINAVSTDTMHRIKFKEGINDLKVLLSYYNSITFAFTEIEGRSYGGGVLEVLPGEVEKIRLPNLQSMEEGKVEELLNLIDNGIRNNLDIEPILDVIDNEVLVNYLGIDIHIVKRYREIWKKLMNRRHKRKNKKR